MKKWIIIIGILAIILSGCAKRPINKEIIYINSNNNENCPRDTLCLDISNTTNNIYIYNITGSLDNPYIFDASG